MGEAAIGYNPTATSFKILIKNNKSLKSTTGTRYTMYTSQAVNLNLRHVKVIFVLKGKREETMSNRLPLYRSLNSPAVGVKSVEEQASYPVPIL